MPLFHFLQHLDIALLYRINAEWTSPFLDWLMTNISSPKVFAGPIAVALVALLKYGGFRERLLIVLMALAIVIGDGCIDNWGKKIIHRPRPNESLPGIRTFAVDHFYWGWPLATTKQGGRSFPSGHALNNVALAVVGCALYGRRARFLWFWAALISYSRVYLGAHYPSDIVGSWIISIIITLLILWAAKTLWRRFAPRWWPNLAANHPELIPAPADCHRPASA